MLLGALSACGGEKECEHSGGVANCVELAKCEKCDNYYGSLDSEKHIDEIGWLTTEGTHTRAYLCCKAPVEDEEEHEWESGICSECGYICQHSGGVSNCEGGAICEYCGMRYYVKNDDVHAGEETLVTTPTTHKKVYSCCGEEILPEEEHTWVDGVCVECGYVCLHKGGEANCIYRKACEVCGEEYGNVDRNAHAFETSWIKTATAHKAIYSCCNIVAIDEEPHVLVDGVCVECGYQCNHSGGIANCANRAICENCGVAYGLKDENNHVGTIEWEISAQGHAKVYTCCKAVVYDIEPHDFVDGKCTVCKAEEASLETEPAESDEPIVGTEDVLDTESAEESEIL